MLRRLALSLLLLPAAVAAAAPSLSVTLHDAKGAPVADAVVSVVPTDGAAMPAAPERRYEISQQGQQFSPYVTAVPVGATVTFPNRDSVQHHVYSLSRPKKFELPLYDPGRSESLVFDQPGVVTLGCNIHDWMLAYLVVVPTPWFAQTAADGVALIAAPAGAYRLEVWHPRLARPLTLDVTLADAPMALALTLKLRPDRRIRRAPDGGGGGYD